MTRRYIVIGAGAVGVALASGLADAGIPAVLVSRGSTLTAIRRNGLRYTHAGRTRTPDVQVVGEGPDELALAPDDVLVLTTKTQDAESALASWAARPVGTGTAGEALPVVTLQNGLDAERSALRRFARVIAAVTLISAQHVVPGEVSVLNGPKVGQLILGAFPSSDLAPGAARIVAGIAADFRAAQWVVVETEDPRPVKAWKAARAATFAVSVLAGTADEREALRRDQLAEANRVLEAAGFALPGPDFSIDRSETGDVPSSDGQEAGPSTWQSFERGAGSEVDHLAGEIVLQARLSGNHAPLNEAIQQVLAAAAAAGQKPGTRSVAEVRALAERSAAAQDHEAVQDHEGGAS